MSVARHCPITEFRCSESYSSAISRKLYVGWVSPRSREFGGASAQARRDYARPARDSLSMALTNLLRRAQ